MCAYYRTTIVALFAALMLIAAPALLQPAAAIEGRTMAQDAAADETAGATRTNLEHELQIAGVKLERARLQIEQQEQVSRDELEISSQELHLIELRLTTFEKMTAPNRRRAAELILQEARDGMQESVEELEQLEMMYAEQELADQTREIVLQRGKRRIERATERVSIQEQELITLTQHTLQHERQELVIEADRKRREIGRLRVEGEIEVLDKRIEIMSAEAELARIRAELAELP